MNRKEFLAMSAEAAAATILNPFSLTGSAGTGEIQKRIKIKKALKFGMVKENLSILDKFKLLKDLGFDGVELDSPNDLNKKEILDARDKTGLLLPGVVNSKHWKYPLSSPDPKVREMCVESMKTALDDCHDYGGNSVLLVVGKVDETMSYDDAYNRTRKEIKKLLPYAEKTGVKIAIENVWNNFLISPMEAANYVDSFDSPMIGWHFDVGNVVRYGWPEQWIKILNKRILKLDIKEYSREKQWNNGVGKGFDVELLDGDCNWPVVMDALEEIDYKGGWGAAEVPGGDRKRLEKISLLMDKIFAS